MPVNFTIEYLPLAKAVTALDEASASYQDICSKLDVVRASLNDHDCIGDTGTALNEYILVLESRLTQLSQRSQELRTGLHETIGDIRDVIDANLIGKFTP